VAVIISRDGQGCRAAKAARNDPAPRWVRGKRGGNVIYNFLTAPTLQTK